MHKTIGACLAVMFLLSGSLSAQTSPALLSRSIATSSRFAPAKLPPLAAVPPTKARARISQHSHSSRRGALIGLAVGVAATAAYWTMSNCRYGSDSGSAIVAQCVVPSAAMIGGGWFIGRKLGS